MNTLLKGLDKRAAQRVFGGDLRQQQIDPKGNGHGEWAHHQRRPGHGGGSQGVDDGHTQPLLHQGARGYLMSSAVQRRVRESHFVAIVTPAIKHLRKEIARLSAEVMPA